jgi:hypothetical protein
LIFSTLMSMTRIHHLTIAALLLLVSSDVFGSLSNPVMHSDSTEIKTEKKAKSLGNWRGLSMSAVSMAQFQGNLESYDASWGARDGLGMITDDALASWRLELNPFEKRQRMIGEFIGITTGLGFDWWHVGIDNAHRLQYDEAMDVVTADAFSPDSINVSSNFINAVYLRVPLLASLHTYRSGKSGFHIEAGFVGGYLLHGKYTFEQKTSSSTNTAVEDFPISPLQVNARLAVGFGKMSLLGEASLLPFFEENPMDSPSMHSFSVGLQFRLDD